MEEDRKIFGLQLFYDRHFYDYRNLENKPLYVDFKKNKNDEGYYLGMYIKEEPNEDSVVVNSIGSYSFEIRKHSDWLMHPKKKFEQRLRYIQALLDI